MPSIKNPNFLSKNRLAARAAKLKKQRQKAAERNRLAKVPGGEELAKDVKRGARPGLLPTSGPRAAISKKKLRKLERMRGYVLKRKLEQEGLIGEEMAVDGKLFFLSSGSDASLRWWANVRVTDAPQDGKGKKQDKGQEQQGGDDAEMDIE
ncbi:hypothetical protein VTJ49DRAFT_2621 [Mycothermus thermophilus]|uniref:Ribosome biogenesis protein ALB1 n=1 Tax=Humicola insolens TaxID=85995 RepID=A0ABR3V9N9_HUMIN